ncbi:MAG: hypothetical protein GYB36_06565 [Alphaproteobacteria bacterium]|nr:hypothetical protein [Alphaproteobacteria bacterium]
MNQIVGGWAYSLGICSSKRRPTGAPGRARLSKLTPCPPFKTAIATDFNPDGFELFVPRRTIQ